MSGFGYNSTAEQVTEGLDLTGTTWLVTGANSGLGLETTRVLTLRGGHVIGAARTRDKAARAFADAGITATPIGCELTDLHSVRRAVDEVKALNVSIDALVANAGIMALPELQQVHGIEKQLFTNHVNHFVLVTGLLDQLTDAGRVVMLSSGAHTMAKERGLELDNLDGATDYHKWRMYGRSKLANIMFARSLATRFAGTRRRANAVHPGVIHTNLGRHQADPAAMYARFDKLKSVGQGAATQCYVATHPKLAAKTGRYFSDCTDTAPIPHALDDAAGEALWAATEQIVARVLGA